MVMPFRVTLVPGLIGPGSTPPASLTVSVSEAGKRSFLIRDLFSAENAETPSDQPNEEENYAFEITVPNVTHQTLEHIVWWLDGSAAIEIDAAVAAQSADEPEKEPKTRRGKPRVQQVVLSGVEQIVVQRVYGEIPPDMDVFDPIALLVPVLDAAAFLCIDDLKAAIILGIANLLEGLRRESWGDDQPNPAAATSLAMSLANGIPRSGISAEPLGEVVKKANVPAAELVAALTTIEANGASNTHPLVDAIAGDQALLRTVLAEKSVTGVPPLVVRALELQSQALTIRVKSAAEYDSLEAAVNASGGGLVSLDVKDRGGGTLTRSLFTALAPSLQVLSLVGHRLETDALAAIATLGNLVALDLTSVRLPAPLTPEVACPDLGMLSTLTSLRVLSLAQTTTADATLDTLLPQLTALQFLDIAHTDVTHRVLPSLALHEGIEWVHFGPNRWLGKEKEVSSAIVGKRATCGGEGPALCFDSAAAIARTHTGVNEKNAFGRSGLANSADSAIASFDDMGLHDNVLRGLYAHGFEYPSSIQTVAIPAMCRPGRDVYINGRAGAGKTSAYSIALAQRIQWKTNGVQALAVFPNREMCAAVAHQIKTICEYVSESPEAFLVVYGGVPLSGQIRSLLETMRSGTLRVVCSTPGRILDLMERFHKDLDWSHLQVLVVEELDRLMEMGFREQLHRFFDFISVDDELDCFVTGVNIWNTSDCCEIAKKLLRSNYVTAQSQAYPLDQHRAHSSLDDMADHLIIHADERDTDDWQQALLDLENGPLKGRQYVLWTSTSRLADAVTASLEDEDGNSQHGHSLSAFISGEMRCLVVTPFGGGIRYSCPPVGAVVMVGVPDLRHSYDQICHRVCKRGSKGLVISICRGREEVELLRSNARYIATTFHELPRSRDAVSE